jgi:hypothetical protein
MQFIFFVPPNEELEGTLHPKKFGCTPQNEGKRVHVLPDEKTCGHAVYTHKDIVNTLFTISLWVYLQCIYNILVGISTVYLQYPCGYI